ncbi:MAG TPA: HD domain-containing phosphohydrolase [Acidobacteriota bacterium]|nr:HD domain-containing phosphohydrolase [Acidobacteriota bacterium]
MAFQGSKDVVLRFFEPILVSFLILGITFILVFVPQKIGFLNFYYLPVLAAGYAMGKKGGVLTAVSSILIVVLSVLVFPHAYLDPVGNSIMTLALNLLPWGGFLILASCAVGYLYEEKQKQIDIVRDAYIGILEILAKLMESVDRYTEGHSVRVSKVAMDIAIAMGLPREAVENIRIAGLLHDIGKFEITTGLIQKAASLTEKEKEELKKHPDLGAKLVSRVGPVLKEAIPIILAHHKFYTLGPGTGPANDVPLGARIVAVADAYDAIVTDRPYRKGRPPWQALDEIRKGAGEHFDPEVVEAFERVSGKYIAMEQ